MPSNQSWLATAATLAIFLGVYLKDLFSAWLTPTLAPALLAVGAVLGGASILLAGNRPQPKAAVWLYSVAVAWAFSWLVTGRMNTSAYYIALPLALLVLSLNSRLFMQLLAISCVLSILIQVLEYLTEDYLFVFVDRDGAELNSDLFAGNAGVFRAKGLAQGPLSAVAFGLWIAFIYRRNVLAAALLVCCAFLASGRLGMTIGFVLLAYRLLFTPAVSLVYRWLQPLSVGLLVLIGMFVLTADTARFEFILSAFNLSNDQTEARLYFWYTSIEMYLRYSYLQMLFGNYGFVLNEIGGTENDLLRIVLDNGIVGFLPYGIATSILILLAIRRRNLEDVLIVSLVLVASMIFPFLQSLPSALLFWIFYFSTVKMSFFPIVRPSAIQR